LSRRFSKWGLLILVGLLCLALVAFPACTSTGEEQEEEEEEGITIPYKNDGSFIQQSIGTIDSLDPAWCYDTASGEQIEFIYETLITWDGEATNAFEPSLATEWEFDEDTSSYRFKIREGVKFHNGDILTPEDVEYSIERALVQDRPAGPVWMFYQSLLGLWTNDDPGLTFADIDAAVEVDGDWVVFTLDGPWWELPFLQVMCGAWASIVDKDYCIAQGDWPGTEETWEDFKNPQTESETALFEDPNGTGPWKLNLWEHAVQIKLERFDDYWGDPAPFDYVITQIVDEWTSRKLALLNGDADRVDVPRMFIGELEGIDDLTVYKDLPELHLDAFFFNMCINEDSPYIGSGALDGEGITPDFFQDIDVRQGCAYAWDYDTFLHDALLDEAQYVGGSVVEGLYGFNPDASKYTYDLDKAAEHLQAAWGGELWANGCKFTLLYNTGNLPRKTACEVMAEGLAKVNPAFEVSIQPVAWATYLDHLYDFSLAMFLIGWQADYPHADNFIVPFMHSTAGTFSYFQCYGTTEIDDKITAAFQELDPATQLADYYELQEIYHEDAPGVGLCQPLGRRYFTKYIHGFTYNPCISSPDGDLYRMTKSES
jgi:peptide/nickel transport system substrate-binding protein